MLGWLTTGSWSVDEMHTMYTRIYIIMFYLNMKIVPYDYFLTLVAYNETTMYMYVLYI